PHRRARDVPAADGSRRGGLRRARARPRHRLAGAAAPLAGLRLCLARGARHLAPDLGAAALRVRRRAALPAAPERVRRLGSRVRSRALLRRAIAIAAEGTHGLEARVNLASSFLAAGQVPEALAAYADAIAAAPDRFEPYLYRGLTLERIGRRAEARADFERVLALNPALPQAEQLRAAIARR